jgi:bifunctional DNA-binding transcriptional regulator/antitoxin component of YhaV-PrlF toxin-antitoxin module
MKQTIRMDQSGRIVIPRFVRNRYGMGTGSHQLEIVESPDGIVLRPQLEEIGADRHPSGWLVFRPLGESEGDPVEEIDRVRENRSREVRGQG